MLRKKKIERLALYCLIIIFIVALCLAGCGRKTVETGAAKLWTENFYTSLEEFSPAGSNPYFILQPGYRLVFEEEEGGGETLIITVLNETRMVDSVETRVVEERETVKGELKEISRNFFAISQKTNSVFYFGEEVDIYKGGVLVSNEGAWISGEKGARFGMMMPGTALLGARFYQEIAPGVAMDRAEVMEMGLKVKTKAGVFENSVKMEETNPVEGNEKEYKIYAPGVGLIVDGGLKLVEYGYVDEQ